MGYKSVGGEALYVAIGSGYRAHPLNEDTTEAIFSIRDDNFREVGGDGDTTTLSDLRAVPSTPDDSKSGWYHMFSDGEKVLSSPAIYNGQVLFSTYAPGGEDLDDDPCVVRYGEAGFYSADMVTGATPSQSDEEPYGENSPLNDIDWSGVPLEQSTIPVSYTHLTLPTSDLV